MIKKYTKRIPRFSSPAYWNHLMIEKERERVHCDGHTLKSIFYAFVNANKQIWNNLISCISCLGGTILAGKCIHVYDCNSSKSHYYAVAIEQGQSFDMMKSKGECGERGNNNSINTSWQKGGRGGKNYYDDENKMSVRVRKASHYIEKLLNCLIIHQYMCTIRCTQIFHQSRMKTIEIRDTMW